MRAEFADLRADHKAFASDLQGMEKNLRSEFKAQLSETRAELAKWMIGAVGLQTVASSARWSP